MGPPQFGGGGEMVSRPVWNDNSVDLHLGSLFGYFWGAAKSNPSGVLEKALEIIDFLFVIPL